nr:zinc finger, CCHC-type [Tanacetum cinerariifolium]
KLVSEHVLEMKGLMDQLHTLGKPYDNMAVNLINSSLNKDFGDFVRNFNMHCVGKTVTELHALLIDFEKGLKDKAPTPQVFTIQKGRDNKPKPDLKKKRNYLMGFNICKWSMEHKQLLKQKECLI